LYEAGPTGEPEGVSATEAQQLERARRTELSLVAVRAFGTVLGLYLVSQNSGNTAYLAPVPHVRMTIAYLTVGALGLVDVAVFVGARRATSLRDLRLLGGLAFSADIAVLLGLTWIYSYDPRDTTWVIMYVLPLEGAVRYRIPGAMVTVGISLVSEIGRQAYLAAQAPAYAFLVSNVAFSVGIEAIIAAVAGIITRSLAREAQRAADQADRSEEAARREAAARRELAAFNTAVLTGVAAQDLDASMRLIAVAIGRDLGWEGFSILVLEEGRLVEKGTYGIPRTGPERDGTEPPAEQVARTGRAMIVSEGAGEMAAPMQVGQDLVGVLDVRSSRPDAFDVSHLDVLVRLADQIALVAHSNQLLSQQTETVRRLQELDQMKSDFVAVASHELRTPITAIRGFVKTLMRSGDKLGRDEVEHFVEIIDRQTARLAGLVEDLLVVSRIEAGAMRLQVEEVPLSEFLRQSVESLGPEPRARIHVSVEPADARVAVDPPRVDQILRNLLGNALKFSPGDSPVDVEARVRGGRLVLSVSDRGIGIPQEELPRIFDRFHQAGDVLSREAEGAGLGLYITKRLVEAMGGSIEVTSTPGAGSTFRVSIALGPSSALSIGSSPDVVVPR
jgi:signal transduction histidine kinase